MSPFIAVDGIPPLTWTTVKDARCSTYTPRTAYDLFSLQITHPHLGFGSDYPGQSTIHDEDSFASVEMSLASLGPI